MQFDEISDFLVQTVERILIKKSSFVYNYFAFVFSQFSLSAVFMKFVASNRLSRRNFESSEIRLLFTQICGTWANISKIDTLIFINVCNKFPSFTSILISSSAQSSVYKTLSVRGLINHKSTNLLWFIAWLLFQVKLYKMLLD